MPAPLVAAWIYCLIATAVARTAGIFMCSLVACPGRSTRCQRWLSQAHTHTHTHHLSSSRGPKHPCLHSLDHSPYHSTEDAAAAKLLDSPDLIRAKEGIMHDAPVWSLYEHGCWLGEVSRHLPQPEEWRWPNNLFSCMPTCFGKAQRMCFRAVIAAPVAAANFDRHCRHCSWQGCQGRHIQQRLGWLQQRLMC